MYECFPSNFPRIGHRGTEKALPERFLADPQHVNGGYAALIETQ